MNNDQTYVRTAYASQDQIAACDDADTLNKWIADARYIAADIKAQLEAERELGTADDDWEHRASTAFVAAKRTVAACQVRLRAIGFYDPPEIERLGQKIAMHCKTINRQRKVIAQLEARVAALVAAGKVAA